MTNEKVSNGVYFFLLCPAGFFFVCVCLSNFPPLNFKVLTALQVCSNGTVTQEATIINLKGNYMIMWMTHWPPEASWLTTMTFSTLDCKVCGFILYLPVDKMPLKKVCPCVLCASVCLHVHVYKTYWLVFRPPGRMMEILHESHLADAGPVFNMKMRWVLLPPPRAP